jgi:hypothetical protein
MKIRFAGATAALACACLIAACGGGGSDSSTPTPAPAKNPPVLTSQPANVTVLTDDTATFTVVATGANLSYQWQKNGTDIAGATLPSFTTAAATYADNGAQYKVVVTNPDGSVTSAAVRLTLKLSADQQAFEDLILAPGGSHQLHWNLSFSGPQVSGTNYAFSDLSVMAASPLTAGPQASTQTQPVNLASTLSLLNGTPTRVLKNGVILVVPVNGEVNVASYTGGNVRIDGLASDGATVALSQIRSGYSTVALSGAVVAAPADLAHWHNSFWSNTAILNPAAEFASGAAYVKYTAVNKGDRYTVFDCVGTTTDANVAPCVSSTTLDAALTAGLVSNSDGKTYHQGDGTMSAVGGVPIFVATVARPVSATLSSTVQYRIYFQLNGNVYTGALTKDGQVLGGSYWVSTPGAASVADRLTFLPFQIRMNKAARDSIASAMQI